MPNIAVGSMRIIKPKNQQRILPETVSSSMGTRLGATAAAAQAISNDIANIPQMLATGKIRTEMLCTHGPFGVEKRVLLAQEESLLQGTPFEIFGEMFRLLGQKEKLPTF